MSIEEELDEDEGGARRRRRRRRRKPKPKPKPAVNPQVQMQQRLAGAAAQAQANFSAIENGRGNALYGLAGSDPSADVAAAGTVTGEITFNDDTWVLWIGAIEAQSEAFMLTSFKVNSFDMVKAGPVNLAAFVSNLQRIDRPTPLTGRRFNGQTKVSFSAKNMSGAVAKFFGFCLVVNEPVCASERKTSSPAPNVVSFRQIQQQAKQLVPRRFGLVA